MQIDARPFAQPPYLVIKHILSKLRLWQELRLKYTSLKEFLENEPLILPTESVIRAGFENLVTKLGVRSIIAANVDDMAMVRLLTREGVGLAVAPSVVLADEIGNGSLATAPFDLGIVEPFFAVTLPRKFPHPALLDLLDAQSSQRAG